MLGGKAYTFLDSNPISLYEIMGSPSEHYFNGCGVQTPLANGGIVFFGTTGSALVGQLRPDRSTLMPVKDMKSVHVRGVAGYEVLFIFY